MVLFPTISVRQPHDFGRINFDFLESIDCGLTTTKPFRSQTRRVAFTGTTMVHYQQFFLLFLSSALYISNVNAFVARTTPCRKGSTYILAEEGEAETPKADGATDILNSPAFLKRKLDVLKSDIAAVEEEKAEADKVLEAGKAEWGPQLDDLQKEYKNIQERMSNQSTQKDTMATIAVVREILNVLDNYDRAFGQVTASNENEEAITAEYKQTYDMILEAFEKLEVKEVKTVGSEFDYEYHQAVMQRPDETYEEGIVCEEFQKGFMVDGKLIRPAMVAVAA